MTREEEKYQAANNAWNLRGLTNQKQKIPYKLGFLEGFDYADQHPRKKLWDRDKVCSFIKGNADKYVEIVEGQLKIKKTLITDLRKAMES